MSIALSETSSLVLICDRNISYQTPKCKEFLSQLDVSHGQELYDCMAHLNPYLDEVIPNRKFFMHKTIRNFLQKYSEGQVLVLACGWDPVLVKMSEEFPNNLFLGVDNESVEIQTRLVEQLMPQSRIFYDQVDITQADELLGKIKQRGWQSDQPTCVVVEGIIYYVDPEAFWSTLRFIQNRISATTLICGDYVLDWNKQVTTELSQKIGSGIFSTIRNMCNHDFYLNTDEDIRSRIQSLGDFQLETFTQNKIQEARTGSSQPWNDEQGPLRLFFAQQ